MNLSAIKDTVLVLTFLGGLGFGGAMLFAPTSVGEQEPTWATSPSCFPVVCDHPDLGAATGNFSACFAKVLSCEAAG